MTAVTDSTGVPLWHQLQAVARLVKGVREGRSLSQQLEAVDAQAVEAQAQAVHDPDAIRPDLQKVIDRHAPTLDANRAAADLWFDAVYDRVIDRFRICSRKGSHTGKFSCDGYSGTDCGNWPENGSDRSGLCSCQHYVLYCAEWCSRTLWQMVYGN